MAIIRPIAVVALCVLYLAQMGVVDGKHVVNHSIDAHVVSKHHTRQTKVLHSLHDFEATMPLPSHPKIHHIAAVVDDIESQLASLEDDEALKLDEMEGTRLFAPRDAEVKMAIYHTYLDLLRLRRYLYVCPLNTARFADGFTFMKGDNIKRAIKLGIRLVGLIDFGALSEGSDVAAAAVQHSTEETAENIIDWAIELSVVVGEEVHEVMTRQHENLWYRKGQYVNPNGFSDVIFSNIYEAYLDFLAHRNTEGEWNRKAIDETRKSCLEQGSFKAAAAIEAVVNHKITTGLGLGYTLIAIILILIPEPGTTAAGAAMLVGGAIYGATSWTADTASGNIVSAGKLTHLMSIIITHWAWETQKGCLDAKVKTAEFQICPAVDCDIVTTPCKAHQVCLREYMFSGSGQEGNLEHEFLTKGWCSVDGAYAFTRTNALKTFGASCVLHRECESGYCHFGTSVWDSTNMWDEFKARHESPSGLKRAEIPDRLRGILLDGGTCAIPVAKDSLEDVCTSINSDYRLDSISHQHKFSACVHKDKKSTKDRWVGFSKEDADEEFAAPFVDPSVVYGKPYTMWAKKKNIADNKWHLYYWYSYDGAFNNFPTLRLCPESMVEQQGNQVEPILLSTVQWQFAQQGAFVKLDCKTWNSDDTKCTAWRLATDFVDTPVKYGDYFAMIWEFPTPSARRAVKEADKGEPPAIAKYVFLETGSTSTVYFTSSEPDSTSDFPAKIVFQMREKPTAVYRKGSLVGRTAITKSSPVAIMSMRSDEYEICHPNFAKDKELEYQTHCEPAIRPHVGNQYAPNAVLVARATAGRLTA